MLRSEAGLNQALVRIKSGLNPDWNEMGLRRELKEDETRLKPD